MYYELPLKTLLKHNHGKENDRCLLNLQVISSIQDIIVTPLLNFLFRTPNVLHCHLFNILRLRYSWDKETDRCFPNL